ncbi:DUF1801 domain-containing protein [uncultured Psychroserpens sp.]|uniref:DUF1801 domain-containing protein n=1 Tax=uncultured Psychroserpens sp. TaxID=255436 RepID=UPI0026309703|nr:DUF1801 domain-containing protein [uncultured Psychroserpens sp.]
MAGLATKETNKDVSLFINNIESEPKKEDAKKLLSIMEDITGSKPKIWGDNFIIGFGNYKYRRKNGKEEFEWFNVGFAPRKTKFTVYLTLDINDHEDLLKKLGKCKWGKGCLYINKLKDVNLEVLKQLITRSKDAKWH